MGECGGGWGEEEVKRWIVRFLNPFFSRCMLSNLRSGFFFSSFSPTFHNTFFEQFTACVNPRTSFHRPYAKLLLLSVQIPTANSRTIHSLRQNPRIPFLPAFCKVFSSLFSTQSAIERQRCSYTNSAIQHYHHNTERTAYNIPYAAYHTLLTDTSQLYRHHYTVSSPRYQQGETSHA